MNLNRNYLVALKAAVTIAVMGALIANVDLSELWSALERVDRGMLLGALLLQAGALGMLFIRWWTMLRALERQTALGEVVRPVWVGLFANNFLPGGTGLDVAKLVMIGERLSRGQVAALVILERAIGVGSVFALGSIAYFWDPNQLGPGLPRAWPLAFLAVLISAFGLVISPWGQAGLRWARRRTRRLALQRFLDAFAECVADRPKMLLVVAITLLVQTAMALAYFATARSVAMQVPLVFFLLAIPVVFVMAALPISIGGLGVREASLVSLAIAAGLDHDLMFAVAVLVLAQTLFWTLPGGLLLWLGQSSKVSPVVAADGSSRRNREPPSGGL